MRAQARINRLNYLKGSTNPCQKLTLIPSTKNPHTKATLGARDIRKVAAYARVSTNTDEQYSSYEAQVNYYMKFIQDRADWRYINVYADEGINWNQY